MTEDDIKLAAIAYSAAQYSEDKYGSPSYEQKWALIEELREKVKSPFLGAFDGCFDFSIGAGWWLPLFNALTELKALMEQYPDFRLHVLQIKEKFGDLRFYYRIRSKDESSEWIEDPKPVPEDLHVAARAITDRLEEQCYGRCEVCGEPGEQRNTGWVKTLCDMHAGMSEARNKKHA